MDFVPGLAEAFQRLEESLVLCGRPAPCAEGASLVSLGSRRASPLAVVFFRVVLALGVGVLSFNDKAIVFIVVLVHRGLKP